MATWDQDAWGRHNDAHHERSFPASFLVGNPTTLVDNCVEVTDTSNGGIADTLGTVCANNTPAATNLNKTLANFSESYTSPTFTFGYSRTITVDTLQCKSYVNTAAFTTNTTLATDSATRTMSICPTVPGLTMGYWQNKNGQARIKNANQAALLAALKAYHPFSDAPNFNGSTTIAGYVYNVIKVATCTSTCKTCNSMLKAQMLATTLNVYFTVTPGGEVIDLVHGCKMIDSSDGTATCSGAESWSPAFGGATTMTVSNMLAYQNTSDPLTDAGAVWYSQNKVNQVLAKDAFDAINNGVALAGP
jgi:hypothetical protein